MDFVLGRDQAGKYLAELVEAFESLGIMPKLGRACDHIAKGYRRHESGGHVIFYTLGQDGVPQIEAVLDEKMIPEHHLGERGPDQEKADDAFSNLVSRHLHKGKDRDDDPER